MVPFTYLQAASVPAAVASGARHRSDQAGKPGTDFFAGGTDLIQLMREHVRNPGQIVDITALPGLAGIEAGPEGARLGALVRMSDAALHAGVREHFPVVTEALLASASPQVRHLATLGRKPLAADALRLLPRRSHSLQQARPGSGCPAQNGQNRLLAILGSSNHCLATYAGDFANALLVLDATVTIAGPGGGSAPFPWPSCTACPATRRTLRRSFSPES